MKRFAVLLLPALFCLACSGGASTSRLAERGAASGYNVLLITLDTTRADRLGAYGRDAARTPVLDGLADAGLRYEHALTPVPITLPSHASMLTGLLPPNHGVRDNAEYHLGPDHETLAERLGANGYDTAAFVSAFVLESRFGLDQGFDLYEDETGFDDTGSAAGHIVERSAETVTRVATTWLETRERERPFFAWVHYFDPHMPHRPPSPFDEMSTGDLYDGEIAYMDSQIGRLMQTLVRTGGARKTIVVVVADHGEGLGEHGEDTHAMLIYDSVMRVPLILHVPGIVPPGRVEDRVVSTIDLLPTVLDLLGIDDPRSRDGISLLDPLPVDRAVYLESLTPYLHNGWSPLFGLRRVQDKYILAPRDEYYDLGRDPGELQNLAGVDRAEIEEATAFLADALADRLAGWPSVGEVAALAEPLDTETIEKLRALGYVDGGAPTQPTLADPKDMMPVLQAIHRAGGLLSRRRPQEALVEIEKAAALSPRDRTVLQIRGAVYLMLGRDADAERDFLTYLEIKPTADVCAMLAQIKLNDGEYDEAHRFLDQAVLLDPHHGVIYLTRGDLYAIEGRKEEAIAAYERAGHDDPSLTGASRSRIASLASR